jgi:hypothetical protein
VAEIVLEETAVSEVVLQETVVAEIVHEGTVEAVTQTGFEKTAVLDLETVAVAESHPGELGTAGLKTALGDFAQSHLQKTVEVVVIVEARKIADLAVETVVALVVETVDHFGQTGLRSVLVVVAQEKLWVALV